GEPNPEWMQKAAVVIAFLLVFPTWAVLANLLRTVEGRWGQLMASPAGRFAGIGLVFYFFFWIDGIHETLPAARAALQFTYWVPARDHLALLGAFTFMTAAGIYYGLPRLLDRPWYRESLANAHFWLSVMGSGLLVVALALAGLTQSGMWASGVAFDRSLAAVGPYLTVQAWAALLLLAGHLAFAYNVLKTATATRPLSSTS